MMVVALGVAGLGSLPAQAEKPIAIEWSDLKPAKVVDPYDKLSPQQIQELAHVARVRGLIAAGKLEADGTDAREVALIEQRLAKAGVDIAWLLSVREQVARVRQMQASAVEPSVTGKKILLNGFVVPVTVSEGKATEFILVSSATVCSHDSPPSANQAVLVHWAEGVPLQERHTAVQISGELQAKSSSHILLRAGAFAEMTAAYEITPNQVAMYAGAKNGGSTQDAKSEDK